MKKSTMMILSAVALFTAACSSSDELQQQTAQPEGSWSEYVTVSAGTPGGAEATTKGRRVAVDASNPQKSLWETGDQLTIWTGSTCSTTNMAERGFTLISGASTGTGKFSGRLVSTSAPTSSTPLIAIIDNGSDAIDASAGNSVSADLSEQQGATAETALDYELYYATSTNATRNFTFTHKMALVKWTIKVNGVSAGDQCDIVLSGTGLKNSATLDPATGTLTVGSSDGTITLKDVTLTSAASTELYVVLPPCTVSSGITATLTMTSGSKEGYLGIGSLGSGAISVAANNYYTAANEFLLAVQLWSGGPYWATMNVGASSPEDYGLFFAWGETTGYTSSTEGKTVSGTTYSGYTDHSFDWAHYSLCNGTNNTLTKYNSYSSYGTVDNETKLDADDDAATANCGSAWRMPTSAEIQALVDNTVSEWGQLNGVNGCYFYKNDGSGNKVENTYIFLPAAGFRNDTQLQNQGSVGYYWSSEIYAPPIGYTLFISSSSNYRSYYNRSNGHSVRPVLAQ